MSLEKVLSLAHAGDGSPMTGDPAAELVAVALSGLAELSVYLASPDNDDDDSKGKKGGKGGDDDSKGSGDHSGHPTFKRLKGKGMNDKMAAAMCAKADNRVKASELCDSIVVALSGLDAAGGDWVEATSFDPLTAALSGKTADKPYGDVTYADPGYNGKKRYPIDTEAHVRAALSYIAQKSNAAKYTADQLRAIKSKIRGAARKLGIGTSDDSKSEKVAASYVDDLVELARGQAANAVPFHHGPMNGVHSHPHNQTMVHDHDHQHVNDNSHQGGPLHRAGSQPNRDW
jgi:hypothetical protein